MDIKSNETTVNTVKIIAICGGAGSGRKSLAAAIGGNLISQTLFLHDNVKTKGGHMVHPHVINSDLLFKTLTALKNGEDVTIGDKILQSTPVILFEGPFAFSDPEVSKLYDLKIYIDCDLDTALGRIIARDMSPNTTNLYDILERWDISKHTLEQHIAPMKLRADIIIQNQISMFSNKHAGVNLIKSYIRIENAKKTFSKLKKSMIEKGDWI